MIGVIEQRGPKGKWWDVFQRGRVLASGPTERQALETTERLLRDDLDAVQARLRSLAPQ